MAINRCKKLLLSRYFNDNTYLIAGICSKCYDELEDVKITGVNKTFLKQFENKRKFKFPNENEDFFLELDVDINFEEGETTQSSQNVVKNEEGRLENISGCFPIKSDSFEQDQILITDNISESREESMKRDCNDVISLLDSESRNYPIKSSNFGQDQFSFSENVGGANENQTAFLDCDREDLDQIGVDQNASRKQNGDFAQSQFDNFSDFPVPNMLSMSTMTCDNNEEKEIDFLGFGPKEIEDMNTLKSKLNKAVQKLEISWKKTDLNKTIKEEPKDHSENENVDQKDIKYSTFFANKIEVFKTDQKVLVDDAEKKPSLSQLLDNNFERKFGSNSKEIVIFPKLPKDANWNETDTKNEVSNPTFFNWSTSKKNFLMEPIWHPPKSPHNLIEESLYHDPWALLVATIFLNKTSAKHARPYITDFLKDYTNPFDVIKSSVRDLEKYFEKIGLKKRSVQIWRMSHDFIHKNWNDVKELYGVGKYGKDAFNMFCLGNFEVQPKDRYLKIYKAWYQMVYLRKDVDFNQNFTRALAYKDDEWCFSDDTSDPDSDHEAVK